MNHQTHYEVLIKQNGRWEMLGRYAHSEKQNAIEEAKSLDGQKHIQAVKVIQEIYDPTEGTSREYNVYAPGQKKYNPTRKAGKSRSVSSAPRNDPVSKKQQKNKPSRSFINIILVITLISAFSTVVGSLFTWFTGMFLANANIGDNAQINILFIVFLSIFVISAVPMALVFLGKKTSA